MADGRLRKHLREHSWIVPNPEVVAGFAEVVVEETIMGAVRRASAFLEAVTSLTDWLERRNSRNARGRQRSSASSYVDLGQEWRGIRERLLGLIGE